MDQAQDKTPLEKTVDDLLFIVLEGLEEAHGEELTFSEVTIRTVTRDGTTNGASRNTCLPSVTIQTAPISGATTMGRQDRITLTTGNERIIGGAAEINHYERLPNNK